MRKVLIIDTSILCVWLQVAGMEAYQPVAKAAIRIPRRRQ